jgi:hypothetical protein
MKTTTTTAGSLLLLAAALAPHSATAISYYIVSGGGFVEGSHSADFLDNPDYGHQNNSEFAEFSQDLNGNPVYMDFSWGGLPQDTQPDNLCRPDPNDIASRFRSCLRILDNVHQTNDYGSLPNNEGAGPANDMEPNEQLGTQAQMPTSSDDAVGYAFAENVESRDDPGAGELNPLGWFTHYNQQGNGVTGTVDVHWALRAYEDAEGFEADAADGMLQHALAEVEAFFRLGIEDTTNVGGAADAFRLAAISFDGEAWEPIAGGIVADFPWLEFEDGNSLFSINLYAMSRNPRCPTCTGEILSPEGGFTTGWVNLRLEDRTIRSTPLPSNLALFGIGLPLVLAMRWRSRWRRP